MTLLLLFAGGLVTSTGSGLAVPDWPLSFGTLFPAMKGGVRFEHSHRVIAGFVVILTMILVALLAKFESRKTVRGIGYFAIGAILFQALLGGMTVLLRLPPLVSVLHAAVAQLFFCSIVTLAVVTSPNWGKIDAIQPLNPLLPVITVVAVYGQIILGAIMRHVGAGLAIPDFPRAFNHWIPPAAFFTFPVAIHFAHRVGALVVAILLIWTAIQVFPYKRLRFPALWGIIFLALQIFLGAEIIWTQKAVLPATLHVVTGASILATQLVIALYVWRERT